MFNGCAAGPEPTANLPAHRADKSSIDLSIDLKSGSHFGFFSGRTVCFIREDSRIW